MLNSAVSCPSGFTEGVLQNQQLRYGQEITNRDNRGFVTFTKGRGKHEMTNPAF